MPIIAFAYLADLVFGDPSNRYHPVAYLGKAIALADKNLNQGNNIKLKGTILTVLFCVPSYLVTFILLDYVSQFSGSSATIISVLILWLSISATKMTAILSSIRGALSRKDLAKARILVGQVVGRDTDKMDAEQISRSAVESISENTVDAIIAPLFYALIGGAPLALAYRVANTLDSMVGYKTERYLEFGWASAKLDDVLNYIPARINIFITMLAAFLSKESWRGVYKTAIYFGHFHASPNSGYAEAAVAGALNLKLGGKSCYGGKEIFYGYLGDGKAPNYKDIDRSTRLFRSVTLVTVIIFTISGYLIKGYLL